MSGVSRDQGITRRGFIRSIGAVTACGSVLSSIGLVSCRHIGSEPRNDSNNVSIIVVDGKRYPVEEFREELPFLVVIEEELEGGRVFGFRTKDALTRFLAEKDLLDTYLRLQKPIEEQRKLSDEEKIKISKLQNKKIMDDTKKFKEKLEKYNITPQQKDRIIKLLKDQSQRSKGRTSYLYQEINFNDGISWPQSLPRVFGSAVLVPDLRAIGFDDMVSSVIHHGAIHELYENPGYSGRVITLFGTLYIANLGVSPYYFNDSASSVAGL